MVANKATDAGKEGGIEKSARSREVEPGAASKTLVALRWRLLGSPAEDSSLAACAAAWTASLFACALASCRPAGTFPKPVRAQTRKDR